MAENVNVGSMHGFIFVALALFATYWIIAPLLNKALAGVTAKYPSIGF